MTFEGKNIWYVHPYAGGPTVGRYTRPYALAKYWRQSGAAATVFTAANHHQLDTPQPPGSRTIQGVAYEFVPCRDYKNNGAGRLLNMADLTWNLWRNGNAYAEKYGTPDLIISSSPHPYAFLASHRLARRFQAKSVFEVRDLWPLGFIELLGVPRWHPLVLFTGWLERYAYRHADAVVSLLPKTKSYMVDHGLAHHKWRYIPNGIDDEGEAGDKGGAEGEGAHSEPPCVERARALKASGHVVVTYTGALGKPNHVESLIEALALANETGGTRLAAVIVGRGEREAAIKALVKQHHLDDTVSLYSQIPKTDVQKLLKEVDIGYISLKAGPLFRFGISPNKMFDYMQAGLPVLSSIHAGNDPVQEAGCGVSTATNDPGTIAEGLIRLARMSALERKALGQNGRAYVLQRHAYRHLANDYLRLFKTKST